MMQYEWEKNHNILATHILEIQSDDIKKNALKCTLKYLVVNVIYQLLPCLEPYTLLQQSPPAALTQAHKISEPLIIFTEVDNTFSDKLDTGGDQDRGSCISISLTLDFLCSKKTLQRFYFFYACLKSSCKLSHLMI
jgi:hypothetical protein